MDSELSVVARPGVVYRVARGLDPFEPPDWSYAADDGTFGNRFDDPGAGHGIPETERFRVIYCAGSRAAAFGETIARYRPDLELLEESRLNPQESGHYIYSGARRGSSHRAVPPDDLR